MTGPYETVVGMEVHVELATRTKVWCGCSTRFGQPPNSQVCPVCLGLPGALPVLNRRALELAMRAALALNCRLARRTEFERKNYYYPDLPKNYQISQLRKHLATDGWLEIELNGRPKRVGIENLHLEEDAGKNIHPETPGAAYSLVDLNRAGTPLIEIVTRPDLRSSEEALAFMNGLKSLLQYIEVSDCNMHEGRLRFEANVSVRPAGSDRLGTKVEIKNLASTKIVARCIDHEAIRQADALASGGQVVQETRLWDEARNVTVAMRSKEEAQDYRYFPDPDLVEVVLDDAWIERVRAEMPELPLARRRRFIEHYGLPEYDAHVITADKALADYYETAVAEHGNAKAIANWIMTEVLGILNREEEIDVAAFPISPSGLGRLVRLIDAGTISGKIAKTVFRRMLAGEGDPEVIVRAQGLAQITDAGQIEAVVDAVLREHPGPAEDYRQGKERALGFLVGQVMKAMQGKANPQTVNELIRQKTRGG